MLRQTPERMNWFYAENGQQKGPVTEEEILRLAAAGTVRSDTLVWKEGLPSWAPWTKVRPAPPAGAAPEGLMAPEPPPAPVSGEPTPQVSTGTDTGVTCAECGRKFPAADTVQFGDRHVCAQCKPVFLQRVREGAPMPTGGPGAWASEAEVLARSHAVPIGDNLAEAWRLLTVPFGVAAGAGILIGLIDLVTRMIPYLGGLITLVINGPLTGGLLIFYLQRIRGGNPELGVAFSGFGPRFGALFLSVFLPGIITGLCSGVLAAIVVVPLMLMGSNNQGQPSAIMIVLIVAVVLLAMGIALFLASRWQYTLPLVADKGYSATDAMRLSWAIVGRNPMPHIGFFLVRVLVMFAGVLALCVGYFFAMPLTLAALAYQHQRQFGDLQPRA